MSKNKRIGIILAIIGVALILISKSLPEVQEDDVDAKRRAVYFYPGIGALVIGAIVFVMGTNKPASPISPSPVSTAPLAVSSNMFGTRIPSSVAFIVAILLFLLPLSEIKCGGSVLMNKSGIGFALGKEWKFVGGYGKDMMKDMNTKTGGKKEGNTQYFIIGALAMGICGLITTFSNRKTSSTIGAVSGVIGAGALIGFMIDLKKWFNDGLAKQASEKASEGADSLGLDKLGDSMSGMTLTFTPWFYVAVVAFLAAAFFCYKRMTSIKS